MRSLPLTRFGYGTLDDDGPENCNMCCTYGTVQGRYPGGGDAGHGGIVELVISMQSGSLGVETDGDGDRVCDADSVRIVVAGDAEIEEFAKVLRRIADALSGFVSVGAA